jgi:hypothetical protein
MASKRPISCLPPHRSISAVTRLGKTMQRNELYFSYLLMLLIRYWQQGVVPNITSVLGPHNLEAYRSKAARKAAIPTEMIGLEVHRLQRRSVCGIIDNAPAPSSSCFLRGILAGALPRCIGIFRGRHKAAGGETP